MNMRLSDFDYFLPKELIAQYPAKRRDASRMMVLDRKDMSIRHKRFSDIVSYVKRGDAVVMNDSKVLPARLHCRRETGGKAEVFLLKKVGKDLYEALMRPASKLFPGRKLFCEDGRLLAEVVENREVGKLIKFADVVNVERDLGRMGRVPLPPYIKREPEKSDEERYQTIYAKKDGSTASPTAGLHFTKEVIERLRQNDVDLAYVTLHVSYGTFAPIKVDDVTFHKMHAESFELPGKTQDIVNKTKAQRGKVVAVGTTTARVLEANADAIVGAGSKPALNHHTRRTRAGLEPAPTTIKGETDFFIYPPYKFRIVDALLTNFHLPKSTLLLLVSAFAGKDFIFEAYAEAIRKKYRFYSYGDCMLIL